MQTSLQSMGSPVSKSANEQLMQSTIQATSLILSVIMCSPAHLPQFSRLDMADGSMNDHQGPDNAAGILVSLHSDPHEVNKLFRIMTKLPCTL